MVTCYYYNMAHTEARVKAMETFVTYTLKDIHDDYRLTDQQIAREWAKVMEYNCNENKNSFVGNKLLYHYQFENLAKTTRKTKRSFDKRLEDEEEYKKLWEQTKHRSRAGSVQKRLFQCHQINTGSIVFFKTPNAMYLYKKYGATKVLDPCAGWGGRGIAAVALGIQYTGIDTNTSLKPAYDKMFKGKDNINMIWKNCLDVDMSELDFDFVMTSPPYIDIEVYEHMPLFGSKDNYYNNFLIPLINKCRNHCKGAIAINISPVMYKDLIKKYAYDECVHTEDLKEHKQGKASDLVYVWE